MGCTISSTRGRTSVPLQVSSSPSASPIVAVDHTPRASMEQSYGRTQAAGTLEDLEAELRRFSMGGTEIQTLITVGTGQIEDDSSSSSSESSQELPGERHPADGTRSGPVETQAPTAPIAGDAQVGLLYDQSMEQHYGPEHYEKPARIIQLYATLQEQQLLERCWQLVPRQATHEELLLAHSAEHIHKVDTMFSQLFPDRPEALADENYCYADGRMGDVYLCAGTARAARTATGCCVQAVHSVLSGAVQRALAVVRPPGHHAECDRAMGFCFFNNVAVAALAALKYPGVQRVAVLDWDVHHGNGIQNVLLQRPDALYLSLHRDPKRFYPFHSGFVAEAGEGPGTGFNVNVPWLKKGMADGDYMAAFSLIVEPILASYQPDLIIVAAGFDAADGDPLGGCKLSPEGYAWMTERLMRFAGGRLVLALEGGYSLRMTSWCAAACVRCLLAGQADPAPPPDKEHMWPSEAHNSLKLVYEFQRQHWPVLRARSWSEAWEAHLKDVLRMLGSNVRSKRASGTSNSSTVGNGVAAAPTTTTTGPATAAASSGEPSRPSSRAGSVEPSSCAPLPYTAVLAAPSGGSGSRSSRMSGGGGSRRDSAGGGGGGGSGGGPAAGQTPHGQDGGGWPDVSSGLSSAPGASMPSLQAAFQARKAARDAAAAVTIAARAAVAAAAAAATAAAAPDDQSLVTSPSPPPRASQHSKAGFEIHPAPKDVTGSGLILGGVRPSVSREGSISAVRAEGEEGSDPVSYGDSVASGGDGGCGGGGSECSSEEDWAVYP